MALINCPECGKQVSEKAFQCPQCAYPFNLSNSKIEQQNFVKLAQPQIVNVVTNENKSEGLAILLSFLLGPIGLFYLDSNVAIKYLLYLVTGLIVIALMFGIENPSFEILGGIISVLFWISSMVKASELAKLINIKYQELDAYEYSYANRIRAIILQTKGKLLSNSDELKELIELINLKASNEDDLSNLIQDYNNKFHSNFLDDLGDITSNKVILLKIFEPFHKHGFISNEYFNTLK